VNFLEGRGKKIYAEVSLDAATLGSALKTDAQALIEVQYRKNLMGSIAAGSMGYNAHFANVLAAVFIATGQDVAQIVEGAMGVTTVEAAGNDGVLASVYLPDVPLGVVGGGTALGPQHEALSMLSVAPHVDQPGAGALRFAEILGATVLAGELSLLAAFTSGDLAGAHERLGRGEIPE
jgi:hydroxymethylglutaryl-CoA reductase (NADPH)